MRPGSGVLQTARPRTRAVTEIAAAATTQVSWLCLALRGRSRSAAPVPGATAACDEPRAAGLGGWARGRAARGSTGRRRVRAARAGGAGGGSRPQLAARGAGPGLVHGGRAAPGGRQHRHDELVTGEPVVGRPGSRRSRAAPRRSLRPRWRPAPRRSARRGPPGDRLCGWMLSRNGRWTPSGSSNENSSITPSSSSCSPSASRCASAGSDRVSLAPLSRGNRNGQVPHQELSS